MTEEEIKALQDAKEAAEKRAAEAEQAALLAKEAADKASSDLQGVVTELTDERKKKNEALEKLDKINNPNPGTENPTDIASAIEAEFAKRESNRIKSEMEEAIQEFKNSKTEFQNDTAGLVFDKFKKDLSKFSFADVKSKAEAKARLEEAYRFMQGASSIEDVPSYEGTPTVPSTPKDNEGRIPADTEKVLQENKITQESYNKLSSKYGDALRGLGFGS